MLPLTHSPAHSPAAADTPAVPQVIAIISSVYEQERELSEGVVWDTQFDNFTPRNDNPENDQAAMVEHQITVPGLPMTGLTPCIALCPNGSPMCAV